MSLATIDGGAHADTRPDPATVTSERTGQPASILDAIAYPLTGACCHCRRPVRLERFYAREWTHA